MARVPVFQASKTIRGAVWSGVDYDYPVGIAAARASQAAGYSIDGVVFVAEDTPTPGWLPFLRYVRNGFHFYTTYLPGENLTGWTATPASTTAYLLANAQTPTKGMIDVLRYWSSTSQTGVAHFFTASSSPPWVPPGFVSEPSGSDHTGWVYLSSRVEFQVTYDCSGQSSGISVTGGNATGQTVTVGGSNYVMQADDALVPFGVGNWIRYNKADANNWHIAGIDIVPVDPNTPPSDAIFDTLTSSDDTKLAVIDTDNDNGTSDIAYKYTLQIYDVALDRIVNYDPRIINRSPSVV